MTPSLEKEIKMKRALFRQYKRSKSATDRQVFNQQQNRVTKLLRKAERAHVLTLYRDSRCSSSASASFWDFMRSLSGKTYRPPIPDLQSAGKELISSSQEKAEALNTFVNQTDLVGKYSTPDATALPINSDKFDSLLPSPDVERCLFHPQVSAQA